MADDAGALLVRSGLVPPSALDEARVRVATSGGTVGEHLVGAGAINDDALTAFYRSRLLVPQVNPNTLGKLPVRVVSAIPSDMAIELRAIPVSLDHDNNLTVAMSDPSDSHAVDEIAFFTGAYVVRAVATQLQIAWCLAHYYGHITTLGQRLLQPATPPAPAPAPRAKGNTGQVQAMRHRALAPITQPLDVPRPVSGPLPTAGELRSPNRRAASIRPPMPDPHEGEDVISMEVDDDRDTDTHDVVADPPPPIRRAKPNPPELAERAGEMSVATGRHQIPMVALDEPRIIVTEEPPPQPAVSGEIRSGVPHSTIEVDDTSVGVIIHEHLSRESEPVLLDRRAERGRGSGVVEAEAPPDDTDVVELSARKPRPSAPPRARPERRTQVGIGALPAITRGNHDTDVTGVPLVDPDPTRTDAHAYGADPDETDETVDPPTGQRRLPDYDALDDGWGPPGTTIPPPLLGAVPGLDDDDDDDVGGIPMPNVDSAPLIVAPPSPPEPARGSPALPSTAGPGLVRALEDATSRSIELIHALERSLVRDDVIAKLVAHLAESHRRAGFFSIKNGELGVFSMAPRPELIPVTGMRLDRPSTLQDVVGTRLPYRGPMHDDASRNFLAGVLGACPPEILLVPVAVRERVVGVLFGEHRLRHTFDDQIALAARAAGMALERILKSKRG